MYKYRCFGIHPQLRKDVQRHFGLGWVSRCSMRFYGFNTPAIENAPTPHHGHPTLLLKPAKTILRTRIDAGVDIVELARIQLVETPAGFETP